MFLQNIIPSSYKFGIYKHSVFVTHMCTYSEIRLKSQLIAKSLIKLSYKLHYKKCNKENLPALVAIERQDRTILLCNF
jgi:hypothetical protein